MKNTSLLSKRAITVALTILVFFAAGVAVPSQAQTPTVLYSFKNGSSDAAAPTGNIVQGRDGFMYGVGTAAGRGANNAGAVYKISPAGVEKVFFNFPVQYPDCISGLTLGTDGNFYGTCEATGAGQGIIYRLTPAGVFTDVHDFASGGGVFPPIQASDGNFYGVIAAGIYKMTPAGVFTMIHTFVSPDVQPVSNLTQASDGNLYGTLTLCSNGNRGCVYKVSTAGVFAEVNLFADPTGSFPCTGVVQGTDGKLYGATDFGGGTNNSGDLYSVTTAGVEADLHAFNSTTDGACNPGSFPVVNMLQVNDGNFYGTNYGGANANNGSIYKLTAAHVFSAYLFPGNGSNGGQPYSTLIQNTNGKIYGSTSGGGANSTGTFFSVSTGDPAFVLLQETAGRVGSKIGILGQAFSASSVVKFNGVTATTVTRTGSTFLLATVPAGANDGFVTVTTGTTTLTSSKKFVVHDSWSSGAPIPTAVAYSTAAAVSGRIYVVGGVNAAGTIVANTQIYNPATNTWSTGGSLPTATANASSAVVNNVLYVFGGFSAGPVASSAVWEYNVTSKTWTAKAAMPTARWGAIAVVEKGLVYVAGGSVDNSGHGNVGTLESYSAATNTWSTEASMTVERGQVAGGLIGTTILVADGSNNSGTYTGDNEGYNAATNAWTTLTADPQSRWGSCSGSIGSMFYDMGGTGPGGTALTVAESFNLSKDTWTTTLAIPQSTIYPGSAVSGGQLYCFGGWSAWLGTANSKVQIYQP